MDQSADGLRFLVDVNLGKVVRWLRALGFDTLLASGTDDQDLLWQAQRERRVLLTRDRPLAGRRRVRQGQVQAVLVRSEQWREQLSELAAALPLMRTARPFTRCLACNTPLASCPLERAWRRVPVHIYQTQRDFRECPSCGRVYWRGTHWSQMQALLATLAEQGVEGKGGPHV